MGLRLQTGFGIDGEDSLRIFILIYAFHILGILNYTVSNFDGVRFRLSQ
jgi:hypothetical protein